MKFIIRCAVIISIILACNSSLAHEQSATETPEPQPLVGMPYTKVVLYKPLNHNADFTKSFVRWVNIIKACQRVDKSRVMIKQ